ATGSSRACCPIQASIPSTVTRWLNTTSGGASMSMEVAYSAIATCLSRLRAGLGRAFERSQPGRPEPVQVFPYNREPVGADHEQVPRTLPVLGDQARIA